MVHIVAPMPGSIARCYDRTTGQFRVGVFTDSVDMIGDPGVVCLGEGFVVEAAYRYDKVLEASIRSFSKGASIDCFSLPHLGWPPETALLTAQKLIASQTPAPFRSAKSLACAIYGFGPKEFPTLSSMGLMIVARTRESHK